MKRGDLGWVCLAVCLSGRPSICWYIQFDVGFFVHATFLWRSQARAHLFFIHTTTMHRIYALWRFHIDRSNLGACALFLRDAIAWTDENNNALDNLWKWKCTWLEWFSRNKDYLKHISNLHHVPETSILIIPCQPNKGQT